MNSGFQASCKVIEFINQPIFQVQKIMEVGPYS